MGGASGGVEASLKDAKQHLQETAEEFDSLVREGAVLAGQAKAIAFAEVQLAVAEVQEGIQTAAKAAIVAGAAAVVGALALFWASASLFVGLNEAVPAWQASLITLGLLVVCTAILAMVAKRRVTRVSFVPEKAIRAVKEDREWLLDQLNSKSNSTGAAKPSAQA